MKKSLLLILVLFLIVPVYANADVFLEVPVISPGKIIKKTDKRLEIKTKQSHDEVVAFYREALKSYPDIKYRDWADSTYIEDDGKFLWHSITISKEDNDGISIVIVKDSWTWIIGTLVLRYIGVFIVLIVLLVGMSISGAIISRYVEKNEAG